MNILETNPHKLLGSLRSSGLLNEDEFRLCLEAIDLSESVTSALQRFANDDAIWQFLASEVGKPFAKDHRNDIRVVESSLMNFQEVIDTQSLPWHNKGRRRQLLSYRIDKENTFDPDKKVFLEYTIMPPGRWRRLYELMYPRALTGQLSDDNLKRLITFSADTNFSMSEEQQAELYAHKFGYEYLDVHAHPPDERLQSLLTIHVKESFQAYPHSLTKDNSGQLIVLMVDPSSAEARRFLEQTSRMSIVPAITTKKTLSKLIEAEKAKHEHGAD